MTAQRISEFSVTDRNRPRELSDAVQANTHLANVTEPSGRAVVTLSARISGHRGRDVFLGRYGLQESRGEYARVLAEWNIAGTHLGRDGDSLTIVELCLAHVDTRAPYYRKEGEPRLRWAAIIASLIALQKVYGRSPLKLCGRQ